MQFCIPREGILGNVLQTKLLIKGSNSVLPEREIWEMFYLLVGFLKIIYISVGYNDASTVGMNLLKFQ